MGQLMDWQSDAPRGAGAVGFILFWQEEGKVRTHIAHLAFFFLNQPTLSISLSTLLSFILSEFLLCLTSFHFLHCVFGTSVLTHFLSHVSSSSETFPQCLTDSCEGNWDNKWDQLQCNGECSTLRKNISIQRSSNNPFWKPNQKEKAKIKLQNSTD